MTVRIGFVGSEGSSGLGEVVRPLVPPGCALEVLSITEAMALVGNGELMVLIVALDGPSWHTTLQRMMDLHAIGEDYPLAVFGLVPRADPAALVKAFELRVADVAGLPMDPHEVRARLAALVRRRQVAFARAAEARAAWRMAILDPVTGLYNRHHLEVTLPAAVDSARTQGRPLALLMIDLDALKPFNDRWGHAAGDRVLRSVAEALQASVRVTDTIARYGGDEIAVVMPDTDGATARAIAARLVRVVAQTRIGRAADGPTGITVSIGLATLNDGDVDVASLLLRADAALYDAKRGGRNRVAEAA
jgi:diguanylate cyclase (GGDEF)-like protein